MHITKQQKDTEEQKIGKCLFRHCTLSSYHTAFVFGSYQWFCHIDDDMYVNVLQLSQFLQLYDPHKPYYIGKWPISMRTGLSNLNEVHVSIRFINCTTICDRAYKNRPCERKLHQVIFLLISFVLNELSHFRKLQKKAH